ncbi:S8 family serine peptidase [Candidatus Nitrotoga sp. AM1P]|uniref:S8 family serine peptidase n=1 Tax=Candidatus Nitrotoga sp. AM1P TaxID=2559597 RepID=UPI0015651C9A|nr:S8 family serine peptidase [Candidatus Nitrotoga sp. AM1P]
MSCPADDGLHLFGFSASTSAIMSIVKDSETGNYLMPAFGEQTKEALKRRYAKLCPSEEWLFERTWPAIWALCDGAPSLVVASLDSGVMRSHPALYNTVIGTLDYTGEGAEDKNGHGTICAILTRMSQCPFAVQLISMKVLNRHGAGNREFLLNALHDLPSLKGKFGIGPHEAHIRCGVYTSRFGGLLACDGTCAICKAAELAANAGIYLQVSVGNDPNRIACPASAGVKRGVQGIHVLTEIGKVSPGPPINTS